MVVGLMKESRQGLWGLELVEAEVKESLPEAYQESKVDRTGQWVRCGY